MFESAKSHAPTHQVKGMGRTSRRRHKRSKPLNIKQDEDRISNLPDELIVHIISFLPTKYAVATSVLSTKWKELWTLTTSLEFDDNFLLRDPPFYIISRHQKTSFISFVDRVLERCQSLRNIHFNSRYEYGVCRVNAWITSVLKRENIEKLYLDIPMEQYTIIPGHLFRKETLVELKLGRKFVMDIAESVWLPRLKVLKLHSVKFLDDGSFASLLGGCPLLEKLSLSCCFNEDVDVIHICAPVLTSLELDCVVACEKVPFYKEIKMVVDTPMLSDLIMDDSLYEYYEFKNPNHLKKAQISLQGPRYGGPPGKAVYDIFEAVSGVQILLLGGESMEVIELYESRLPIFQHLTKLILFASYPVEWKVLPLLLEKSPHLRTLTFLDGLDLPDYNSFCDCWLDEHVFHDEICHLNYFCPRECVPNCLVHHLKRIELGNFAGDDRELLIINYFLENARVLEKLVVHYQYLPKSKKQELVMLPRPSGCEIEFFDTEIDICLTQEST